jgi:hypothetical protein
MTRLFGLRPLVPANSTADCPVIAAAGNSARKPSWTGATRPRAASWRTVEASSRVLVGTWHSRNAHGRPDRLRAIDAAASRSSTVGRVGTSTRSARAIRADIRWRARRSVDHQQIQASDLASGIEAHQGRRLGLPPLIPARGSALGVQIGQCDTDAGTIRSNGELAGGGRFAGTSLGRVQDKDSRKR